jgi:hypothetical protein
MRREKALPERYNRISGGTHHDGDDQAKDAVEIKKNAFVVDDRDKIKTRLVDDRSDLLKDSVT